MSSHRLTFTPYSNLKLGYTTHNFTATTPVTEKAVLEFVDYTDQKGFSWFELRDPNASLSKEACNRIAAYAQEKAVEIAYSNQRSFLDPDFFEIYEKGIENATAFEGPKTIRGHISGKLFDENPGKIGLTQEEFDQILEIVQKAAQMAKAKNLNVLVENGAEAFFTNDKDTFGTSDFLAATEGIVNFQLDTANAFSGQKPYPSAVQLQNFVKTHISRLTYIHLKSEADGEALPWLQDSKLDYGALFSLMSQENIPYIAIELATVDKLTEVQDNHEKSIAYLRSKGFIQ